MEWPVSLQMPMSRQRNIPFTPGDALPMLFSSSSSDLRFLMSTLLTFWHFTEQNQALWQRLHFKRSLVSPQLAAQEAPCVAPKQISTS